MILPGSRSDALGKIAVLARQHQLTMDEISAALVATPVEKSKQVGNILIKILSYLGALFVFAGLGIYTNIEWPQLSPLSRVVITLGPGVICFIIGILCLKDPKYQQASTPLFVLGGILQPFGLTVYLREFFEPTGNTALALSCVFGVVALQQAIAFRFCRRTTLLFFTAVYAYSAATLLLIWTDLDERVWGSFLSFSALVTTYAISKTSHRILSPWFTFVSGVALVCSCFLTVTHADSDLLPFLIAALLYATAVLGLVRVQTTPRAELMFFAITPYVAFMAEAINNLRLLRYEANGVISGLCGMLLAYGMAQSIHRRVAPALYFIFGFVLAASLHALLIDSSLSVLLVGFGAGLMYVSVVIASRTLLFVSVVALLGYLASFTNKYFANVVGWPMALIGLGIFLILISSYAVQLSHTITARKT